MSGQRQLRLIRMLKWVEQTKMESLILLLAREIHMCLIRDSPWKRELRVVFVMCPSVVRDKNVEVGLLSLSVG